ncbi:MAG TPA: hypothetical protein VHM89_08645 [Acidimicrobiales bacterium]|nr:hypothetical protein [Acidimicrobiales bacterium]
MAQSRGWIGRALVAAGTTAALLVGGLPGQASSAPDAGSGLDAAAAASAVGTAHSHRTHGPDSVDLDRHGVAAAPFAADAETPWSPADYDGASYQRDRPDLAALAGLPMVHVVYVYPREKSSRLSAFGAMFQADARDASRLLKDQYGRGIRFDERPDTRTGRPPVVDITSFHSRYRTSELSGTNQFDVVAGEITGDGRFSNPDKKYVVFLDAPSQYCGQGQLAHDTQRSAANANELRTVSIVYRPYDASDPTTGGFCRGRTMRHELGHNLGALQAAAPNAFDGAHCDDSNEDTMCYVFTTAPDTGGATFDYGNDDYWDPVAAGGSAKLPWWTVNLSRFVCPPGGDCTKPNIAEY